LPDDIISEIRNSAAAGMEITAHEQPVNFYGSSQVGYVILDPATGSGAYKIGGGENGGELVNRYDFDFPSFLKLKKKTFQSRWYDTIEEQIIAKIEVMAEWIDASDCLFDDQRDAFISGLDGFMMVLELGDEISETGSNLGNVSLLAVTLGMVFLLYMAERMMIINHTVGLCRKDESA
jgi:hypothetical protein